MFETVKLPARVPDLDPSLTYMNAYDLSHLLRLAAETLILRCYSAEGDGENETLSDTLFFFCLFTSFFLTLGLY